ncbi:DAZ-associated protein 1 (Deleted in azoospermia-associated protein 1) (Proline-rich Vg1 mRNA-binding protein) [Durusdinium trenchii]|uniref:DAZ-associated protein 1 (Deleted in azoospermia-associated protein 1) (Proline-rich Vg1 mRNA-binding protein) n=1 Tax=Durusdinium trenchii TaxID=1381693 RepID=A0ABP0HD70_9DINO
MADDAGKIFVGGLPKSCAQEALQMWAEQFGEVTNVEVKVDPMGVSRGFGFVTFREPSVAQSIVSNKDSNMMDGKWIDCKMAMPPGSAPPAGKGGKGAVDPNNPKIFVGALPKTATQDSVTNFFSAFGPIQEVVVKMAEDGQCKGFAFVTFEDPSSAKNVLDNYDNNQFEGKWIDCKPIVNKGGFGSFWGTAESLGPFSGGPVDASLGGLGMLPIRWAAWFGDGGQWPPVDLSQVQTEDAGDARVLIFSDNYGYCKDILNQAPPGRIGNKNVQTKAADKYTEKDVQKVVGSQAWDMIIFALGIDLPESSELADVHKQQELWCWGVYKDAVMKRTRHGFCGELLALGMCVITVDCFAEEREIHEELGLSVITNACLFGQRCRVRAPVLYRGRASGTKDGPKEDGHEAEVLPQRAQIWKENVPYLVAEMFRHASFGHNAVRILNKGRYVLRQMSCKPYMRKPEWQLPEDGVIAISGGNGALGLVMGLWLLRTAQKQGGKKFSIQFLSRSMKISEQNMPNWQEVQNLAQSLGIHVEQAKCDVSKQEPPESVESFVKSVTPNLAGADAMLINQTWEKFDAVFEAKSRAAAFLHDALEKNSNPKLKFLWLFSSTSVYGNMGQLNYSASNSWLDALARHRLALGKPCAAPQWGAWGEVGMAAQLDEAIQKPGCLRFWDLFRAGSS